MAVVAGDRVLILAAQRREARVMFGDSNVARVDGVRGNTEPRLEPDYAKSLLSYWIDDGISVRAGMSIFDEVFTTAVVSRYLDNVKEMDSLRGQVNGLFVPDALLRRIWACVTQAAITGFAVDTTPKPWELAKEAVKEAIDELPSTLVDLPIIGTVLKAGAIVLGALVLIEVTK